MRKKTGHPVCVASYGGQKRSFTFCLTPGSNYQKYVIGNLNQFVRSLPFVDKGRAMPDGSPALLKTRKHLKGEKVEGMWKDLVRKG